VQLLYSLCVKVLKAMLQSNLQACILLCGQPASFLNFPQPHRISGYRVFRVDMLATVNQPLNLSSMASWQSGQQHCVNVGRSN
jgi:hypothetical protein